VSYILDALKKSEQERKRGSVPDLLTVQEEITLSPRKKYPWRYLIIPLLLVIVAAAAWRIVSLQAVRPIMHIDAQEGQPGTKSRSRGGYQAETPVVTDGTSGEKMLAASVKAPQETDELRGHTSVKTETPGTPDTAPAAVLTAEKPLAAPPPVLPPPADPDRIYRLTELPESLQKGLPAFTLSAFMYSSSPALRMVRINDRMMREGEELSKGLKLLEVTSDGVVMTLQGYRFLVPMKTGQGGL